MSRPLLILVILIAAFAAWLLWPEGGTQAPEQPGRPATVIDPATAGVIRGRVLFAGTPPPARFIEMGATPECRALHADRIPDDSLLASDGRLRNAVVHVKTGLEGMAFDLPKEPVVVDQKGCLFLPRVAAARAGQAVHFLNSDPTKHNVHASPKAPKSEGFNRSLSRKGTKAEVVLTGPEIGIQVTCDVHPWMIGYLSVFDHPHFAVTGEDGAFAFKGLPPGEYEIEAWHETLGKRGARVQLGPAGDETLDLSF